MISSSHPLPLIPPAGAWPPEMFPLPHQAPSRYFRIFEILVDQRKNISYNGFRFQIMLHRRYYDVFNVQERTFYTHIYLC